MKKKADKKLKKFKLVGIDPQKREMKLSFEQRAYRRELLEDDKSKVKSTKVRRITIDSVFSKNQYRLLVAELKPGVPITKILETKSWETEYSILIDGNNRISDKEDPLMDTFTLEEDEINESRVFLLNDGYKSEITEYAKEDAEDTYDRVLTRKRRRKY